MKIYPYRQRRKLGMCVAVIVLSVPGHQPRAVKQCIDSGCCDVGRY
ncbi:MAG: hypothetical protein AB1847_20135 [bacterium]